MVFVRGFHKPHGQSSSEFSQSCHLLLKSSGWENTLSTWEMHRWSLLTPCPVHLSSALAGRGLFQGMFFVDGCGWLEVCLPTPFDAPTHLLTPSPLLTPPWSSAPSFSPLWHFILPRTRLGYRKTIKNPARFRGLWAGLVTQVHQPHSHPAEPIPAAEPSFKDVWAEQPMA